MPSIGSVIRHITGSGRRPPTQAELAADAVAAFPPAADVDADVYAALFERLAALALRGYRETAALQLPVTPVERALVSAELVQLLAGVAQVVRRHYGLKADPHLQIGMHRQDAIEIRVTP